MDSRVAARAWAAGTMTVGAALLVRPTQAGRWASSGHPPPTVVVRILGARQLIQGIVVAVRPSQGIVVTGALVDLTHAASMIVIASLRRDDRRAALLSAALAGASAAVGAAVARRGTA